MMTNVNHQALKSLSCFAAVTFFSTSQMCTYECFLNTNAMNVLYFLSIVSKPLFFIIMGYMDEVENLTLSNILFKIKAIIIIMLFWYIVPGVIGSDYIQQGYFLQSGTLLGMVGIYLTYPIILKVIRHTHFALVYLLIGMLMVYIYDWLNLLGNAEDPLFIYSYPFIWGWGGYYIIGHLLGEEPGRRFTRRRNVLFIARLMLVPISISMVFYERYVLIHSQFSVTALFALEHIHLLALSLSLFILFDNININNRVVSKLVEFISPAMVGVYIVHYSVFYLLTVMFDFYKVTLPFLLLTLVFIMSVMVSRLLLLNKLTARLISF